MMTGKQVTSEALPSTERAFEWLTVLETVLVGIILGYTAWLLTPQKNLTFMSDSLFALVFPLTLAALLWYFRYFTIRQRARAFLLVMSWSFLLTSFLVDMVFLSALVFFGVRVNYVYTTLIALGVANLIGWSFPYGKIIKATADSCVDKSLDCIEYWKQWRKTRNDFAFVFIDGIILSGLLIVLPFLFFPA